MSTTEVIVESLERASEIGGDPTAAIYARYFAVCPESNQLMGHLDRHMQGRMLTEVLRLLMSEDSTADADYLRFETNNHAGYGVKPHMYTNLLGAVRDTVRTTLGDEWHDRFSASWNDRIDALLARLDSAQRSG
ncbi:MAG: globin [Gammaproteobacteria bacterium]|nr:globin [Gammaproteobacteria bacterium]